MNKTKILGIIAVITSIVVISGCISSNGLNTQTHKVCNSTFQIPEGWDSPGAEWDLLSPVIPFSYEEGLDLSVEQCQDKEDYDYWRESAKIANEGSKSKNMNISSVKVTLVQYSAYSPGREMTGNNYEYYFQKNGKYFKLDVSDYRKNREGKIINEAVNTIITTIN